MRLFDWIAAATATIRRSTITTASRWGLGCSAISASTVAGWSNRTRSRTYRPVAAAARQDVYFLFHLARRLLFFKQLPDSTHGLKADHQLRAPVLPEMPFHLIPEIMLSDELHKPSQVMNWHFG
jgi:hypothetical protein